MDPALATSLVRSPLDEFGDLYPIDLFSSGYNATTVRDVEDGIRGCRLTVFADCTDEDFIFTTGPLAFWENVSNGEGV